MFERAMIGLHLASVAALAVPVAASLAWGADFELLKNRQGQGHWLFIGAWLLAAVLIAMPRRPVTAWRCGVAACAAAWLAAAALGLWRLAPPALGVALSLLILSLAGMAAVAAAGEHRVKRALIRPAAAPARADAGLRGSERPLPSSSTPSEGGPGPSEPWGRSNGAPAAAPARSTLGLNGVLWWSWALLLVQSFWCAFDGNAASVRGSGYVGMLLAFFLMLPALCLWRWLPRAAAAGWGVAAVLWAALAWHTPMGMSVLSAAMTAALAMAMLRAPRQPSDASDSEAIAA